MNKATAPFDPAIKPAFSEALYRAARAYPQDARSLFHALLQNGEDPALYPLAYYYIERQLSRLGPLGAAALPETPGHAQILRALSEVAALPAQKATAAEFKDGLQQIQPIVLTEACWLRNVLQAANNQTPAALDLSRIHAALSAGDRLTRPFRALSLQAGCETPDLVSIAFAEHSGIETLFFEFAALQIALAYLPRAFFPELLGFTLAFCLSPSLLEGFAVEADPGLPRYLEDRRQMLAPAIQALTATVSAYLGDFKERQVVLWQRIATGFALYRQGFERCEQRLRDRRAHPKTACAAVADMLTAKAPAAFGHHRKVKLGGRTLDDWFAEQPFNRHDFLVALRASPYVDRENPAASRLLQLFAFDGPMFGVLSAGDLQCLKRWLIEADAGLEDVPYPAEPRANIDWLPNASQTALGLPSPCPLPEGEGSVLAFTTPSSGKGLCRLSPRELFHYLVNADLYPDVLPAAERRVNRVLRAARLFRRLPFKRYSHQAFNGYVEALYRREVKAYRPLTGKPRLSKADYLFGIEQLAPAILTDGCWLQHVSRLSVGPQAAVADLLQKIYHDETGNGVNAQNHPAIYRRLLDSLSIPVPPIDDPAFCGHAGFIDSAFDIPVYLLAISLLPSTFLPELLGLNLAIELSGLGRVYLRLSEELKYWNIDPKIVDVHITIDNPASGHTALARRAISLYLDRLNGQAEKDAHWRRIHAGYCSLAAASRTFKYALAYHYLLRRHGRNG